MGALIKTRAIEFLQTRSTAGWRGMYYIACPKIGMVFKYTSVEPFTGFPVSGHWVSSLVSSNQMTTKDARKELAKGWKAFVRRKAT